MQSCVAGVDGGGTRSRVLLLAPDGTPVGRAEGPAGLVHPARPDEAGRVVGRLVRRAALEAGVPLPLPALWAALAGAGRSSVRFFVERALRQERVARMIGVGTDVEAALHDAFGGEPGIVVIAGTGSVVLGMAEDGRRLQVGGWGRVMGDQGSAHHIATSALRAVARASDGRSRPTALLQALLDHLEFTRPGELPTWAESATKAEIASIAPHVVRIARAGDATASTVVNHALNELADQLSVAIRGHFSSGASPRVALAGGLIGPMGPLRSDAEEMVERAGGRVMRTDVVAERGAAHMALALLR